MSVTDELEMKHPPYHLRTNKAVDRLLLVQLLRALKFRKGEFSYYSLGGPFLEDLRVLDHYFPEASLCSLEANKQTYNRQQFNRFNSKLRVENSTLMNFINYSYQPGKKDVFWLDYTDFKYSRFEEFQVILKKVPDGSVVRLTLRAEPEFDLAMLEQRLPVDAVNHLRVEAERSFNDEFSSVLPHPVAGPFAKYEEFATMVQLMVRRAASIALDVSGSTRDFLHVNSSRYDDQTQMLSVTGIVHSRSKTSSLRKLLATTRFSNFDWSPPDQINIPALSPKERHKLEHMLPVSAGADVGELLFNELGYHIDNGVNATKRQLSQYAEYHREYPGFVKVSV